MAVARLVVFDMDGVLADIESSWVFVHRHFGVNNDHSLRAYLKGEIDDIEFIRRDIELWKNKDPSVDSKSIARILADVPLMPGAKETVAELRKRGAKTAIVSAGIDLLSERIVRELGMDAHRANGFAVDPDGKLSGGGVLRVRLTEKGNAVEELASSYGAGREEVISVGNSVYDVSMFESSGFGIAFCPSDEMVAERAQAVIREKDLSRVLDYV
jgi:phosphoserine phosphatase